jgi:tRNA nucleotidyltransferase (CCA-adding enzyme)
MTDMTKTEFFEVGGCVRDDLLGVESNDVDFTVVGPSTFEAMETELVGMGFQVFTTNPEFVTVRAMVPESMPELRARTKVADFVLARKDGASSDGRRPDFVEPGTLMDDLARRDFTVNAMARGLDGELVDPFDGVRDLCSHTLRFVGDPMTRLREDGLRMLRGFRFMVTKDLEPDGFAMAALGSDEAATLLRSVSKERMVMELDKMFKFDTLATLELLVSLPVHTVEAMFPEGLRLSPTLKKG